MGIAYFAALTPLLVQGAAPAPAPPPQPVLEPVGQWVAQFEPSFCAVSHRFGDEKDGPLLVFKTLLPNATSMDVLLITPEKGFSKLHHLEPMSITPVDGGVEAAKGDADKVPLSKGQGYVRQLTVEASWVSLISDGRPLRITYGKNQVIVVRPEGLAKALDVLGQCQVTLAQYWKLDVSSLTRMSAPPEPLNPKAPLLTPNDYPVEALAKGHGGYTILAWDVGVDGKSSNCRVLQSSGDKQLDESACAGILRRALYSPAIDKDGKPMVTFLTRRVVWIAPQ